MAHIVYLWIRLKSPLNRVATSLAEYGIRLSRQQLYKNVGITADMLIVKDALDCPKNSFLNCQLF